MDPLRDMRIAEGEIVSGVRLDRRAAGSPAAMVPQKRSKFMRLDKYLKVSRIIKRRTVANEACDSGRVMLNDKIARASAEVKVGDVIEVAFGTKAVKVRVTSVQETIRKEDTKEMFEYI